MDGKVTVDRSGVVYIYQYQRGKITLEETVNSTMALFWTLRNWEVCRLSGNRPEIKCRLYGLLDEIGGK